MSEVVFNPSKLPTVGVEVEAQIVDNATGNLVNIAENIVNGFNNEDRVKHELYLSTVEITSSPALDTNNTYEELSSIFKDVLDLAIKENAGLIATGTHPFALYEDQVIKNLDLIGLYSYNSIKVSEIKSKMNDDIRILFTEYRQKRKGNFNSNIRRISNLDGNDK